jgi:hypothetical protein
MGLMVDLGRGPVGVDTVIVIYFIEEHPREHGTSSSTKMRTRYRRMNSIA